MSPARTKARSSSGYAMTAAADALEGWLIPGVAAVLQVMKQLEERLLHDVLAVAGVVQHAPAEAIQRRAVFLKQPQRFGLRIDRGQHRGTRTIDGLHHAPRNRSHSGSWWWNGGGGDL